MPSPAAPGGAGEIAEAVDRNDNRVRERRDVECRGQMREMVLDVANFAAKPLSGQRLGKQLDDVLSRRAVPVSLNNEIGIWVL